MYSVTMLFETKNQQVKLIMQIKIQSFRDKNFILFPIL